ncbi:unannotated protein [freshwater metagenome]|uniref:Unannotated protein n=1 Tax=freshwater metagenome TaxID=449393 RepID=A0A6J6FC84_9ZZZZ
MRALPSVNNNPTTVAPPAPSNTSGTVSAIPTKVIRTATHTWRPAGRPSNVAPTATIAG